MTMKNPAHPGRLIKTELEDMEISVAAAAEARGVTRQQLYNVINGKSAVTPEMAVRLEQGLGSTADTWLRIWRKSASAGTPSRCASSRPRLHDLGP